MKSEEEKKDEEKIKVTMVILTPDDRDTKRRTTLHVHSRYRVLSLTYITLLQLNYNNVSDVELNCTVALTETKRNGRNCPGFVNCIKDHFSQ